MCRQDHFSKLNNLSKLTDVKGVTKTQEIQINKIKKIRNKVTEFEQAEKNMSINRNN